MPKNTKATLTLTLVYTGEDATDERIKATLNELVYFAVRRGIFGQRPHYDVAVEKETD